MDQGESLDNSGPWFSTCKMKMMALVAMSGWTHQMGLTVLFNLKRTMRMSVLVIRG